MGLFDMFKKKSKVDTTLNDNKNINEKHVEPVKIEIKGKYEFLNNVDDIILYKSLTDEDLESYSQEFKETFKIDLPEDVKEFLKSSNGVFVNGITFLSVFNDDVKERSPRATKETKDIIGHNENYRELTDIEDFIILGRDSLSYFVYDIESKKYRVLSNGSLDVMNEYNDLYTMVKEVIEEKIY